MSVSNISSGIVPDSTSLRSTVKQAKLDFKQILAALQTSLAKTQSPPLSAASSQPAAGTRNTVSSGSSNPVGKDFSALWTALGTLPVKSEDAVPAPIIRAAKSEMVTAVATHTDASGIARTANNPDGSSRWVDLTGAIHKIDSAGVETYLRPGGSWGNADNSWQAMSSYAAYASTFYNPAITAGPGSWTPTQSA